MFSKYIIVFAFISYSFLSYAQCTIPNGDFENFYTITQNGLTGPVTFELPQDWIESPVANIYSRFVSGNGFFYKYTDSDANGNALQIQRGSVGSFINANNGYMRFACSEVPDRLTGRIKFSGSSKADSGWTDRFTMGAFLSTVSDSLRVSDQLNLSAFPDRTKYFITEDPIDTFMDFSIDLSDFQDTGEDYVYFTIMIKMDLTYNPGIDWEYAIAVLDDVTLEYDALSTAEVESDRQPKLYPNPVRDNLYIKNNGAVKNTSVQVYDVSGRLILENNNVDEDLHTLNVSDLINGVYMLRLLNTEQKELTYKFVKH